MAKIHFGGDNNVSKPAKRQRWATQRVSGQSAVRKRLSILNRHKRTASSEEPNSAGWSTYPGDAPQVEPPDPNTELPSRTIYMNVPLPPDAKDEHGNIKIRYARNKIRTSKYTALSFIPKDLWFQFHNIANIYFFFIIILSVSCSQLLLRFASNPAASRYSPFSAPQTPDSGQSP